MTAGEGRRWVHWLALALICALATAVSLVDAPRGLALDHDTCNGNSITIYDPIVDFEVHLSGNARVCAVELLENDAYDMYAGSHGMDPGDPRIVQAGQYQIAGILWELFLQLIEKHAEYTNGDAGAQPLTSDEQNAYDWLHSKVDSYRLSAANDALAEYNRWKATPCTYQTPNPQLFYFDAPDDPACSGTLASLFSGPSPPSYEELVEMGQYDADKDLYTSSALGGQKYASLATSHILEAQGTWAMGLLGTLGGPLRSLLGEGLYGKYVDAVRPFTRQSIARANQKARYRMQETEEELDDVQAETELEDLGEAPDEILEDVAAEGLEDLTDAGIEASTEAAATLGAESLSGPFFIAGIGVAIIVQEGIKVFDEAKIPGQLQDNINAAQTQELQSLVDDPDGGGFNTVYEDYLAQLQLGAPPFGTPGHVVDTPPSDGSVFEEEFADDSGHVRYTTMTPTVRLATWPLGRDQGSRGVPQEDFTYYNGQIWRKIAGTSDDALAGLSGYIPTGELHYYDWSGHPRIAIVDGDHFIDEPSPGSTDVGGLDSSQDGCQQALACNANATFVDALVWAAGVTPSYTTDVLTNGGFTEVRTFHPTDGSLKEPFMRVRLLLKPDQGAPAVINVDNRYGYSANNGSDATPPQGGLHPGDTVTLTDPLSHPFGFSTTYTWTIETRCAYQETCTPSSDPAFHGNPTVTKTGQTVSFTWPAPGDYHVRLTTLDQYDHTQTRDLNLSDLGDHTQTVTGTTPSVTPVSLNIQAGGGSVLGTVHQGSPITLTDCIALPAGAYGDPKVSFDWGDGTVDTGTGRGTTTSGLSFHFGTVSGCNQPWQVTATHTYTFTSSVYQVQKHLSYSFSDNLDPDATHTLTLSPVVNVIFSAPPTFTSASSTTFTAGVFGYFVFTANGQPDPTITAVDTGSLPSGIGVATDAHGVTSISGDANVNSTGGDFTITMKASNGLSPDATQTFTLHVNVPPQISGPSASTVASGEALASPIEFTATGTPTAVMSIAGDTDGLTVSQSTSAAASGSVSLSGTPRSEGTFNYTISATNAAGTATKAFTLVVGAKPTFTSPSAASFVDGNAAGFTVSTAGTLTASLRLTGSLPAGLNFNDNGNGTAAIYGTPTGEATAHVTITATNTAGSATQDLTVTTSSTGGPSVTVSGSPNTVVTTDIDPSPGVANLSEVALINGITDETLTFTSSDPAASLSISSVPDGMAFTDNGDGTATLTGTPAETNSGKQGFEITAHPSSGPDGFTRLQIDFYGPPVLTSNPTATFVAGQNSTFTLTAAGLANPNYLEFDPLPSGLAFADSFTGTATISGTPDTSAVGIHQVTIETENIFTLHNPRFTTQTIEVDQTPSVTSASTGHFGEGVASSFDVTTSAFPTASLAVVGTLPPGIAFHDNGDGTGTFSGTATDVDEQSYPVTVQATNKVTTTTQDLTLKVGPLPQFIGPTGGTFTVGDSSATLDLTSFTTPDVSPLPHLSASGLPSGLTIEDNTDGTATIGGTPDAGTGGLSSVNVTATNDYGSTTETLQLTVDEAPQWAGFGFGGDCSRPDLGFTDLQFFAGNTPDPVQLCFTGYPVPVVSTVGTLPDGLTTTTNADGSVTLAGTTAAGSGGSYPLGLTMSNAAGTTSQQLSVSILDEAHFTGSDDDFSTAVQWVAGQENTYVATLAGYPFNSLDVDTAFLEAEDPWLTVTPDLATRTITLSGTPPLALVGSDVDVSTTVDQTGGPFNGPSNPDLDIEIQPFAFTAGSPPDPSVDSPYTYHFATSAGDTTFAVGDGDALPDGLTLASDGTLSGTPTTIGKWAFSVVATDDGGSVSTNPIELTITGRTHTMEISAFRLYGPAGRGDWFVTARNMTAATIPLAGWKVGVFQPGRTTPLLESLPLTGTVDPGAEVTLSGPYYSLAAIDPSSSIGSPIAANPGGVELVAPDGSVSDKAGVTGAPAGAYSGTPLGALTPAQMTSQMAFVRNTSNGQLVDTDDNASDFTFTTELRSQTVTVTSTAPGAANVGDTYTISAHSTSTNAIVVSTARSTGGACVANGLLVTFLSAGTCILDIGQPGSLLYAASPTVSQTITVRSVTPVASASTPAQTQTVTASVKPTERTTAVVSSGSTAVQISVPAGAVKTQATVTASVAPALATAGVTFAAGSIAVQLTVTDAASSAAITQFDQPVELDFPDTDSTFVPAYSHDGVTWTAIPQITTPPALPTGWPDGWYRDGGGVVHVLTRHATYFAILARGSKVAAALQLHLGTRGYVNLNYGHKLVLHLQPTMPAALTVTLRKSGKTLGTWHQKLKTDPLALTITLPPKARHTGAETVVLKATAGKEVAQKTVPLQLVASWHKPR